MKICPICKKEYKQLTAQHIFTHNLTVERLRQKYPDIDLGNDKTKKAQRKCKEKRCINDNIRCKQCNKLITCINRKHRTFCGQSCAATYSNNNRREKTYTCNFCKNIFKSKAYKPKYCSRNCSSSARRSKRVQINCDQCSVEFKIKKTYLNRSQYHFCGNECKQQYFRENQHLRGTFSGYNGKSQISKYRKLAFENYKNECYYCSYKVYEVLQVHHLDGNRKNNVLENLRIICPTCHAEVHLGYK